jgi:hypothetical protein
MLLKLPFDRLAAACGTRPPEFCERVKACGRINGDRFEITSVEWNMIAADYIGAAQHEPTANELAANFGRAVSRWLVAGMPVSDEATYMRRSSVCDNCTYWDGGARLGLGTCKAPGCGCTRLKRWLATERCPLGKWPA